MDSRDPESYCDGDVMRWTETLHVNLWAAEKVGSETTQAREITGRLQNQRITEATGANAKQQGKT